MPKILFNSANAREMALRSHEARRQAEQNHTQSIAIQEHPAEDYNKVMLTRTREHIESIDRMMMECDDAREWDALTRSREREFRVWAHLAQLPGPGQLKPSAARPQARRMPEPVPLPTIYSVQPTPAEPETPKSLGSNETH